MEIKSTKIGKLIYRLLPCSNQILQGFFTSDSYHTKFTYLG